MTKLRLDQAPAATLPLRFLLAMPCWGVLGGLLLLIDADAPLHSRWHPATLALVHVWTLGVLGNAVFGSLLQFLPAAAGVRVRGLRGGAWLHALFNLGVLLLVAGLHGNARWLLAAAGLLLPASFLWLAAMIVPGLVAVTGQRLLRAGIGTAVGFGVAAALTGGALALLLAARHAWPLAVVDVHASFGVVGWMVLLLAAVGRVTMPMFQGTGTLPQHVQACWLGAVATALMAAALWHMAHAGSGVLPLTLALAGASFASATLWLQQRAPSSRRGGALFLHWRAGLLALALAAPALLLDGRGGLLAGVLAVGIGLPLLVGGMALEIVPFVVWIGLRRRVPRGVQLPGVQRLLDDAHKRRALRASVIAAVPLLAAVLWPLPWLVRLAAVAQLAAWALLGHALVSALGAGRRFLRRIEVFQTDFQTSISKIDNETSTGSAADDA